MVQIDMEMPKVCYKCRFFCVRFCAAAPPVEGSERDRGMRHRQFEDGDEVYDLIPKWCPLIRSVQFTNQLRGAWEETDSLKILEKEYTVDTPLINLKEIPDACKNCPNHPSNGGSGICNCILGLSKISC